MQPSPHLLIIDDDREIRQLLAKFLGEHGYRISQAADVKSAQKILGNARLDLIILDLMLPGEDGLSLFRNLRAQKNNTPVMMLTAMADETDRIIGLELGADDYVTKPFNPREVLARIRAILRRVVTGGAPATHTEIGEYQFDGWRMLVHRRELRSPDGIGVPLSAGEFDLLLAFVRHPQRVLSRDQLLDLARGRAAGLFDRSIDIQVSRLRRKIEPDPEEPSIIRTVRNGGYVFSAPVSPVASSPS
jgi:two-component system, OmpR family, response regulator